MSQNNSRPESGKLVRLKGHDHCAETAKAYCSFISKFVWRENDDNSKGHMIMHISGDVYRYENVPYSVYEEAWEFAHNPSNFDINFGNWYQNNIKDQFSNYESHRKSNS